MRPHEFDIDLDAVDADGIAQSQTPGAAGNLTLNGALGTTLDYARQIGITSAGNDSGRTFTITGTDADGKTLVEAVTGPNATTVESVGYFKTITTIAVDAATAGAITVGTVDEAASHMFPLDFYNPYAATVSVDVTGTIDFTVQQTFDNVFTSDASAIRWENVTALAAKTADTTAQIAPQARAVRVIVNSYSSGAELQALVVTARR